MPTGDIVRYKRKGSVWLEDTRYVLTRKELPEKTAIGRRITRLSYRTAADELFDNAYEVDEDGVILSLITYFKGKPDETNHFAANGALIERDKGPASTALLRINSTNQTAFIRPTAMIYQRSWFPSGQIRQIKNEDILTKIERISAVWDANGHQLVKNGEGAAVLLARETPGIDMVSGTEFIETGQVTNSLKQGVWTGQPTSASYFSDQAYYYQERYKDGVLEIGASVSGRDTVAYAVKEQQPQFAGGELAFQRFLSEKLVRKPIKRSRNEPCCVAVSFTVMPDGTLRDYAITNPVQPDLDQHALHVVQAVENRWKPGTRRGRPVPMRFFVSVPANRL